MPDAGLRHGDVVEVKNAAEILSTLDDGGALEGLPFMPEMVQYCGHSFVVDKRANKVCDTVHYTGSRHLPDAVLLVELRCDGSGHDGCQAECRPFWKEAWLRRVDGATAQPPPPDEEAPAAPADIHARSLHHALPIPLLLVELRCDGAGHDGRQAECRPFGREAWSRR